MAGWSDKSIKIGEVGLWWILVTWKIEKSIKYRWGCLVGVVVVKHSLSIFSFQCAYQIKNIIVLDPADHVHFSPKDEWAEISPWHCHRFPCHPRAKSWIKHLYSRHHFFTIVATYSVSANENVWLMFLTRGYRKTQNQRQSLLPRSCCFLQFFFEGD